MPTKPDTFTMMAVLDSYLDALDDEKEQLQEEKKETHKKSTLAQLNRDLDKLQIQIDAVANALNALEQV